MMRPGLLALAGIALSAAAGAQLLSDPNWKEADAPPPPALRTSGLIELELPPGSALRFAVDPASVTVGPDSVVRFVVVARSTTGTVNAMYEGVRCSTGEVKTYARHNPDSGWVATQNAEWRPLHGSSITRHSLFIARNGACVGHGVNGDARQIVRHLASGADERLRN